MDDEDARSADANDDGADLIDGLRRDRNHVI